MGCTGVLQNPAKTGTPRVIDSKAEDQGLLLRPNQALVSTKLDSCLPELPIGRLCIMPL